MKKKNFIRIIPKLDIKNGLLIKGINLEGLRVLGDPFDFAQYYYSNLADEICYIDSVATLYGTNNLEKDLHPKPEYWKMYSDKLIKSSLDSLPVITATEFLLFLIIFGLFLK